MPYQVHLEARCVSQGQRARSCEDKQRLLPAVMSLTTSLTIVRHRRTRTMRPDVTAHPCHNGYRCTRNLNTPWHQLSKLQVTPHCRMKERHAWQPGIHCHNRRPGVRRVAQCERQSQDVICGSSEEPMSIPEHLKGPARGKPRA